MKPLIIFLLIAVSITNLPAQVGFNNPNPHPNSLLDLTATDKGLLIPRLTTIQRDALTLILNPAAESLLIYDTNLQGFYFFRAGAWYALNEWVKAAGSNDVAIAGNAQVNGTISANNYGLNALGNGPVPAGGIIMWSGLVTAIPTGWALCDGTNGTPDLRDRFIVGAGGSYARNSTGGANSVVLTTNEMPLHSHGINDPGHNHDNGSYNRLLRLTPPIGNLTVGTVDYTASEPDVINSAAILSSATGISINSAGNSAAHENRPPYFALAYIMKL
jgi:microcystin-dependent protein